MTIPEAKLVGLVRVHMVAGGGSGIDDPTTSMNLARETIVIINP